MKIHKTRGEGWCTADIDKKINIIRQKILKTAQKKQYESALLLIKCLANILFGYNQYYTDDFLEEQMQSLQEELLKTMNKPLRVVPNRKTSIFFYDGVGVDDGLELIYIKGLLTADNHVVYLVRETAKGHFPILQSWLQRYDAEIIYMPSGLSILEEYQYIYDVQNRSDIAAGFLYALPYDVSGVMAFMSAKGRYIRYRIDFVDHAYWLGGIRAFDYCIEFRDFGAMISRYFRKIPKESIIMLPYYPYIDKKKEFAGFPFPIKEDDFIIFSGGTLYKTIDDKENLYYKMVEFCLHEFEHTKFWYSGSGEESDAVELKKLQQKYTGRVFWSEQGRTDLYQVLRHVDLYLNTYPVGGGLMLQYAVIAGRVPLIFTRTIESRTLINQEKLGIEFNDFEAWKEEVKKLILDEDYRKNKEKKVANSCIDSDNFEKNLLKILKEQKTRYEASYIELEGLEEIKKAYRDRFGKWGIEDIVGKDRYIPLIKVCPIIYIHSRMIKRKMR